MTVAIVGGIILDGSGAEPVRDRVLLIEGEKLTTVSHRNTISIPRDAEVLDAGGRTILPGIIDCHVHATYRARDVKQHLLNTPTYNILRSTQIIRETIDAGVTTARDMGGADAGFRAAIADKTIPGPRLLISIIMMSQTGGHGDYWVPAGLRLAKRRWLPDPNADGVDAVRRLCRQVLMAGADFIKMCTTGGITSVTDDFDEAQYTVEEVATAVQEAANKGKKVAVHAEGTAGIHTALQAEIHSLEHGWFIDEEAVDLMLQQGTWWVPTLALVPLSLEHRKNNSTWSQQQLAEEENKEIEILRRMKQQVPLWKDAVSRGVKVAMGTDQSHRLLVGQNLVELEWMVKWLGMSPLQAIAAATGHAAECIGRKDLGLLQPGKIADLLIVDGDPTDDITCLQNRDNLHLIMQAGHIHKNQLDP